MADAPKEFGHCWVSVTDDELTDGEAAALDAILPMARDCGAGAATTCGYDKSGYPLGSMTVAFVGEVVVGIAVRNAHDEHAVVVTVMEPSAQRDDDDDGGLVTFTEEEMAAMPKRRLVPFEGDFDVL